MDALRVENLSRIIDPVDTKLSTSLSQGVKPATAGTSDGAGESGTAGAGGGVSFSDFLKNTIEKTNDYQHQADHAMKELVAGRTKNIHETMLVIERADVALKTMMQVRNKVLDAYREVMRMQV